MTEVKEKTKDISLVLSGQEWIDKPDHYTQLILKAKAIEKQMDSNIKTDALKAYREVGKLLQEYSYRHSLEAKGFRKKFMEDLGISQSTYSLMTQLGRMTDEQFINTVNNFPSLHRFANKLPLREDVKQCRKEHAKKIRPDSCGQLLQCFPHCCSMCQYYEKKRVVNVQ